MKKTLLLNSDWSPLNFVSPIRALSLLMRGRAELISMDDRPSCWNEVVRSPTRSFDMPATLRLVERVNRKYNTPRFKKRVLFNRDNWQCQYCESKLDWSNVTIDHVVPRARGGTTTWRNCVAACKKCNIKKGCKSVSEAGLRLKNAPTDPKVFHFWEWDLAGTGDGALMWHPDWIMFFQQPKPYLYR